MRPDAADFRVDINGLRAVAVLAVVLFHFGVAGFSGGFVGVDVFFVISGYLMTRIILAPLAEGRFSVLRFYLARARRIFPALAALCVLMLAYGWASLSPMDYKLLAKHAGASLLFFSNQVYWKESGYFDADAHEKWLLHTWSLSVEWQFYLLYPLLVVAVHRILRRPAGVAGALWAVFLASLAWSAWLAFANPSKAFFLLPARAWEMLAGGLIYLHQDTCARHTQGRRWSEGAGIAIIVLSSLLFSPNSTWPGLNALFPVVGTMLVLANGAGNASFLGNAALQGIGRWSYSIYLWHWPVVVWLYQSQSWRDGAWIGAGMAVSVVLGWLSFRLVENPARSLVSRLRLVPALAASAAMVLLPFAVAAAFHFNNDKLTKVRFKDHPRLAEAMNIETYAAQYRSEISSHYREGLCLLPPPQSFGKFAAECSGKKAEVAVWGDSHAAHLWPGLKAVAAPGSVAQWTANGCPPLIGVDMHKRSNCREINNWIASAIEKSHPKVVILAGAWIQHDEELIRKGLAQTLARLKADPEWRPRIVLVGSVPAWRKPLPKLLASDFLSGSGQARSRNDLDPDMYRRDALIRQLADAQAEFFSPISVACNDDGCLRYFEKNGARIPFAFDYGHLIDESSVLVISALFRKVQAGAP